MGDSNEFYVYFYSYIDELIANFIQKNTCLYTMNKDDQKNFILMNLFPIQNNTDSELIHRINNNLTIYLEMIQFIKENDKQYMPMLFDFTKLNYVFNRFCYHYSKVCMNNECIFSQSIYKKIMNIKNFKN